MNILVTGSNGFLGKNLVEFLRSYTEHNVYEFSKKNLINEIDELIENLDIVFHFAGLNKANNIRDYEKVNVNLTLKICNILKKNPNVILFYASSTQVYLDNPYGRSKRKGENICLDLENKFHNKVFILRLPGIFGIGCKPNYNSVVGTFCFNSANNLDLKIIDPNKEIELVYINDLCKQLTKLITSKGNCCFVDIENKNKIKISELAKTIQNFKYISTKTKFIGINKDLEMKLYETYLDYKNN